MYVLYIGGAVMFRGTKKECYRELQRLMDNWVDDLPEDSVIEVRSEDEPE